MKKSHYEAPTSELLVVRFEENIMSPQIDPNGTQRSTVVDPFGDEWPNS